jgi:phospholipid/cholesterol/gamma-HCH transport system substrate-binding protein
MDNNSEKRAKLGLLVTVALLVSIAALYFIGKKQQLFGTSFRISGIFADVGGLRVGNNVRLAGVNIGSVEAITIQNGRSVRVEMVISEDAHRFIKKDAVASVGSESLMGNKVVLLAPGSDDGIAVVNQDVIRTSVPLSVDDILEQLHHTGGNVVAITDDLARLTGTIRSGKGTLGKMFMDKEFAADLSSTMKNLKDGSSEFKDFVESAQKSWLLWGSGKSKAQIKAEADEKIEKDQKSRKKNKEEEMEKLESKKRESGNYDQVRPDGEPAPAMK